MDFAEVPSLLADAANEPATGALVAKVKAKIREQQLKPCVRTVYYRCAFQSPASDDVRITLGQLCSPLSTKLTCKQLANNSLDTNLYLLKESGTSSNEWCKPLTQSIGREDCLLFPLSIVEVKLQEAAPAFLEELLRANVILPCTCAHKPSACKCHLAARALRAQRQSSRSI